MRIKTFTVIAICAAALAAAAWFFFGSSGHKHDGHGHETGAAEHDHAAEKDHDHGAEVAAGKPDHDDEETEGLVRLDAEQAKLVAVGIAIAAEGRVGRTLELQGEIKLNADATAQIMPRMPGFVAEIFVREGDQVAKGELLAKLMSHKLGEYYSAFNSAAESEALTRSEFEMAEKLRVGKAISEREYLRYKREYAEAVIARARAAALLDSLLLDPAHKDHGHAPDKSTEICTEYEVRSPVAGTVITKSLYPGENFPEDNTKVLFTVSDLRKPWLELRANHQELREIKPGMKFAVRASGSEREYSGTVIYVAPLIDEATRTGLVRLEVDNPDMFLRPGEFASGSVELPAVSTSVTVPRVAVQLIDGETVVFIPVGDAYKPAAVKVGRSSGGVVEILAGLKAGESYVDKGAFELKSILLASGMNSHAGHGH